MLIMNMDKVKKTEGYTISAISYKDKMHGVVTIPDDGFARLVGYMLPNGRWGWIPKEFRK